MTQTRPTGMFFDDFTVGMKWRTPGRTITVAEITQFCGISGMPQTVTAERVPIMPLAGVVGIATGLAWVRLGINESTALAVIGMENWQFKQNVLAGDTIFVEQRIAELRPSRSQRDRGIVRFVFDIRSHQRGLCQRGEWVFLWLRAGAAEKEMLNSLS